MRNYLIPIFIAFTSTFYAQGLTSNYSDANGAYLRLGPKPTQFSIPVNLNFSGNSIFTSGGPITAFRRPTLKLNPINGNVTIGSTESDFAGLTIRSASENQNNVDLRLEGHGHIGIQSSMFIQLDDDADENAFFLIRDSEMNNLFTVGENGTSYLKGDFIIDGDVKVNGSVKGIEEISVFTANSFVVDRGFSAIRTYGDLWFSEDIASAHANVSLPHNARITKIEVIYKDNSNSDIEVSLRSVADLESSVVLSPTNLFAWDSSDSSQFMRKAAVNNLDIVIDNVNNNYRLYIYSDDWGGSTIIFRSVKIYYTR